MYRSIFAVAAIAVVLYFSTLSLASAPQVAGDCCKPGASCCPSHYCCHK